MTMLDDFLSSLSEEDKRILKENKTSSQLETEITQEEKVKETYKQILDLQVASGQISESDKDQILFEIK